MEGFIENKIRELDRRIEVLMRKKEEYLSLCLKIVKARERKRKTKK